MKLIHERFTSKDLRIMIASKVRSRLVTESKYSPQDRIRFRRLIAKECRMLKYAADFLAKFE